jgi:superfamily II DNA/RNA helicase
MSFNQFNLDASISKAIAACGYTKPTPIQTQSIPKILHGHDIVACAQTGTGKTAAFVLPALNHIRQSSDSRKPRVLILTPTRELATQIKDATNRYGKFLRFNMASLVGGMSYRTQLNELSRAVDLIVATPGRLLDHIDNRRLDLRGIEMLILDEADRMLDMGFIDDVKAIAKMTPQKKQTLLFSATIDGKLNQIIKQLLNEPVYIDLSQEKMAPTQIKQELYMTDSPSHKARLLQHFLANEKMFKTIIFTATKIGADNLAGQLIREGFLAAPLHGDLKQSVRNKTVEKLRRNKLQYLVATDVAARGIDISDVTHVINYDLPRFHEDYVHRIGRTGRAGKSGKAISFALHHDKRQIEKIERYIGQRMELKTIEGLEPSRSNQSNEKSHSKGSKKSRKNNYSRSGKTESRSNGERSRRESTNRSSRERFHREASSDRPKGDRSRRESSSSRNSEKSRRDFGSSRPNDDRPRREEGSSRPKGEKSRRDFGSSRPSDERPRREAGSSRRKGERSRRDFGSSRPNDDRPRREAGSSRPKGEKSRRDFDSSRPSAERPRREAGSSRPNGERSRRDFGSSRPNDERPRREAGRGRSNAERSHSNKSGADQNRRHKNRRDRA